MPGGGARRKQRAARRGLGPGRRPRGAGARRRHAAARARQDCDAFQLRSRPGGGGAGRQAPRLRPLRRGRGRLRGARGPGDADADAPGPHLDALRAGRRPRTRRGGGGAAAGGAVVRRRGGRRRRRRGVAGGAAQLPRPDANAVRGLRGHTGGGARDEEYPLRRRGGGGGPRRARGHGAVAVVQRQDRHSVCVRSGGGRVRRRQPWRGEAGLEEHPLCGGPLGGRGRERCELRAGKITQRSRPHGIRGHGCGGQDARAIQRPLLGRR
mmetsp:Transcript_113454/g.316942  ORF Transcript_113454/g.316942 Transcript_113454/m.316942 type:complete len:267 (+) Transcript_113454:277-1077(+)